MTEIHDLSEAIATARKRHPKTKWMIVAFRSDAGDRFRIYRRHSDFRMNHTRVGESPQQAAVSIEPVTHASKDYCLVGAFRDAEVKN
jgi:hypothetical protein